MKICLAQTKSIKGAIQQNIQHHLKMIADAVRLKADLIVFPELSVTEYEPELAVELATDVQAKIFDPFQVLADDHRISIGIGVPTKALDRITLTVTDWSIPNACYMLMNRHTSSVVTTYPS